MLARPVFVAPLSVPDALERLSLEFPEVAMAISAATAQHLASGSLGYPQQLRVFFDGVPVTEVLALSPSPVPTVITFCSHQGELLMAFAYGILLLNRLPERFVEAARWST